MRLKGWLNMANTYVLIQSIFPTTSPSQVDFINIPQTYTDLLIKVSGRNSSTADNLDLYIQPYNFSIGNTYIRGNGATVSSTRTTNQAFVDGQNMNNTSANTANTFSNTEFYIPNYSVSGKHVISGFMAAENNSTTAYIKLSASIDTTTTTITAFSLNCGNGFVTGSSFYLYGIKNS